MEVSKFKAYLSYILPSRHFACRLNVEKMLDMEVATLRRGIDAEKKLDMEVESMSFRH